jgi:hypothetical protein
MADSQETPTNSQPEDSGKDSESSQESKPASNVAAPLPSVVKAKVVKANPKYEKVTIEMNKGEYDALQKKLEQQSIARTKRSEAAKARYAAKSQEEKDATIARLAAGREVAKKNREALKKGATMVVVK